MVYCINVGDMPVAYNTRIIGDNVNFTSRVRRKCFGMCCCLRSIFAPSVVKIIVVKLVFAPIASIKFFVSCQGSSIVEHAKCNTIKMEVQEWFSYDNKTI